jgi:hypothetical protein
MWKQSIASSETPDIFVRECLGSLTVRGRSVKEITLIVADGDQVSNLERGAETVSFSAAADCTLICPLGTALRAERVLGNVRIEDVKGTIDAQVIHGNASLRAVGPVSLGKVLGNLSVYAVAGDLKAGEVKGNTRVRGVTGVLTLTEIGGNLRIGGVVDGLEAGHEAGTVRGNVQLGPPFSPQRTYRVNTRGNLIVRVPGDASLRIAVRARGNVDSDVPGLSLEREGEDVRGSVGGGRATLDADVWGNVSLRPVEAVDPFEAEASLEDLGAEIERQVNEALATMATRLEASLGRVDVESGSRRVEQATEKARREAERAAERARLRAERAERRWQRASGREPLPRQAATDEERLRVLRMVEDGKITPEQASELLTALEG